LQGRAFRLVSYFSGVYPIATARGRAPVSCDAAFLGALHACATGFAPPGNGYNSSDPTARRDDASAGWARRNPKEAHLADSDTNTSPRPVSLGEHPVSDERRERIVQHVQMLSETARKVSDGLPFAADTYDIIAVLDANADDEHPGDQ
jgi:hypothetical protein